MKIKKIKLTNFRCFDEFEIDFSADYNIHAIVAENMVGKSALLNAIKISANTYITGLMSQSQIRKTDHRVVGNNPISDISANVSIETTALVTAPNGELVESNWIKYKNKPIGESTKVKICSGLDPRKECKATYKLSQENSVILPLFSFIGTEYIHIESSDTIKWEINGSSLEAYKNCFEDKSIKKYLFNWLAKIDSIIFESTYKPIIAESYKGVPQAAMNIFKKAVKDILPDIQEIEWSKDAKEPVIKFSNGDIRLYSMLSDGYRYLILLSGELATRAFLLNKSKKENILRDIYGIVIIDEFGIHLHPSLQNDALTRLSKTFPNIQFIISTHSPLTLNGLRKEQVHILSFNEEGKRVVRNPDIDIIGLGADQITTEIFGLPTTLDNEYLKANEEYKKLFNKKREEQLTQEETTTFKQLSKLLSQYRLDPEHSYSYPEDIITRMVKDRLKELPTKKLTESDSESLRSSVNNIIDNIFSQK